MRNIICIGASSGGVRALSRVVAGFPPRLNAAVFIVMHRAPRGNELLPEILAKAGRLPVALAQDRKLIHPGQIHVAPADFHLLLEKDRMRCVHGPKENWSRPAIDPLFRTAAEYHGPRSIGVVLSGSLDDGAAGLWNLKRRGGLAVVQDPADAEYPEMPQNALNAVSADHITKAEGMGSLLANLCLGEESVPLENVNERLKLENALVQNTPMPLDALDELGQRVPYSCPICSGPLWRLDDGPTHYRCHIGHGHSPASFLRQYEYRIDETYGSLLRLLEENRALLQDAIDTAQPNDPALPNLRTQFAKADRQVAQFREFMTD